MEAPYFDAMERPRGLGLLVAGTIVSTLGSSIYLIALVLYIAQQSGSPVTLGVVQLLAYLPAALLGTFAGVAADRWDRRRILVLTDAVRGVLMVGVGAVGIVTGMLPLPLLIVATIGISVAGVFFVPAAYAITPNLVSADRLRFANAMRSASMQISNVAGTAIGGFLFALVGAPVLVVGNGVSFLMSALSEMFLPKGQRTSHRVPLRGMHVRDGVSSAAANGVLRPILVHAGINLSIPLLITAMPFVVMDQWGLAEGTLGVLFAAVLAGGVAGYTIVAARIIPDSLPVERWSPRVLSVSFAVIAFSAAIPGGALGRFAVACAAAVIAGASVGAEYLVVVTSIQERLDASLQGRVFALLEVMTAISVPVGYGLATALAALSIPLWTLPGAAALVVLLPGLLPRRSPTQK